MRILNMKTLGTALLAAVIAGIIGYLTAIGGWVQQTLYDRLKVQVLQGVLDQLDFKLHTSEKKLHEVEFACEKGRLISASCVGYPDDTHPQAAVGPIFSDDKHFKCYDYGGTRMNVQASGICFGVKQ
jgi:hypothetical protein